MKRFPWLVPAVSILLSLALAAVAAIIGIRFAAPEQLAAPAAQAIETEVVPIIEPIAVGARDDTLSEADADAVAFDVSPAIGEIEVPVSVSVEGESTAADEAEAAALAVIEAMGEADDPVGVWDGGGTPSATAPAAPGDPCAALAPGDESAAPAGCPVGLRSTILALTTPPELIVIGLANPPTRDDIIGIPAVPYCPAVDLAAGEVSFAVGTNVPATITLRYWPVANPSDVGERVLMTSPTQVAAWDEGFMVDPPDYDGDWFRPQHCTVLDGVRDFRPYLAELFVVDQFGREVTETVGFSSSARPGIPPLRVLPVGDAALFVSAPHTADQVVQISAYRLPPGVPTDRRTCAGLPASGVGDRAATPVTRTTAPGYNERNGFLPQYDRRTTSSVGLGYGQTFLLCVRWFDGDRPSFEADIPVREYRQFVSTPDPLQPMISVDRLDLVRGVRDGGLLLTGRDLSGGWCGSWRGPTAGESFADGASLAAGDRPSAIVCQPGTTANLVVITSQVASVGGPTSASFAITVPPSGCSGAACEAPEPLFYRVALADVRVPTGLCGSSFGSCDPPTRLTSVGSLVLRLDWVHGTGNGLPDWVLEAPIDGPPDVERPAAPQLDTNQRVRVTDGAARYTSVLSFNLVVDRPAEYTVRVVGDCVPDGLIAEQVGRVESRTVITFPNACLGTRYRFEVVLVGDDGTTSTWSPAAVENRWERGVVDVPGVVSRLVVSLEAKSRALGFFYFASPVDLEVAGRRVALDPELERCVDESGVELVDAIFDGVELATLNTITLTLVVSISRGSDDARGLRCTEIPEVGGTLVLSAPDIPISELYSSDGIVMTAPDGAQYVVRLAVRAAPGLFP